MKFTIGPYRRAPLFGRGGAIGRVPPPGSLWALDLSSIDECGNSNASPQEVGVFAFPSGAPTPLGHDVVLPDGDFHTPLSGAQKTILLSRSRTQIIAGDTIGSLLFSMLVLQADPDGQSKYSPLMPAAVGVERRFELHTPSGVISKALNLNDEVESALFIAVKQREYRRIRTEVLAGRMEEGAHQRLLDKLREEYRLDEATTQRLFIPGDLPREAVLRHQTTYGPETFDKANGALGPVLTWTEVAGNLEVLDNVVAATNSGEENSFGRAEHDTSSSDTFAQVTVSALDVDSPFTAMGPTVRYASGSNTGYTLYLYVNGSADSDRKFAWIKWVGGVGTGLTPESDQNPALSDQMRGEISGSTLTGKVNSLTVVTVTDTALSSGTRGGIFITRDVVTTGESTMDNFSFGDLASGVTGASLLLLGVG